MARIVKLNALLLAYQVEETIWGPGPDGNTLPIATAGDYATYLEVDGGEKVFKGFLSEKEYHEKHRRV